MLSIPATGQEEAPPLTPDEFDALQESLQRYYREVSGDEPEEIAQAEPIESIAFTPAEETDPVAEEPVELPTSDIATEIIEEPDPAPQIAIAEPEAWIAPLLDPAAKSSAEPEPTEIATLPEPTEDIPLSDQFSEPAEDIPPLGQLVEETPVAIATTTTVAVAPDAKTEKSSEAARPKTKKRRDRLSWALFLLSILILGAAALIYFVNPFSRLALGAASLARPVASPELPSPTTGSGAWCLSGEFLSGSGDKTQLTDSGASGDILAEDSVYSLDYAIASPGSYKWQVIDCNNEALAYPAAPAWVTTTEPNQVVTFNFDSTERSDPLFFPIPHVVSALDDTDDYQIIGDFQGWNPDDASGKMQKLNLGLFQHVRRIARSGSYEGYVIAGDREHAIDAYGRTTDPIPFSFTTERNGEYVVFLVDTDRGRASIMYDMPPVLTSLAYGSGNWMLSGALVILAGLLLIGVILRRLILHNKNLQMESGCPNCGRHELMRISRRPSDRVLHMMGIPAYRYRCRNCTWEGMRLSEEGTAVSAGVPLAFYERD
ncbi:MAG TPA: hypothetical protein PK205_03820 [Promineifilum sp.]|nr:hypothetical protein [Promineifilum sp.]HRO90132.1 hypothetical protein [Promineifilum sp.]HRQ12412.1 hypothetical protein [Promineifilum sp.]